MKNIQYIEVLSIEEMKAIMQFKYTTNKSGCLRRQRYRKGRNIKRKENRLPKEKDQEKLKN